MIGFLIKKPVSVIMVFIALVLLGIMASLHIPVSPLPDIGIPEITVHISKDNLSAKDIESTVVQTLRSNLQQVSSIDNVHSETRDGYSIIKLRFKYGSDVDMAFMEVNEKIDLAMNSLPKGTERPRAVKASATDIPVFYLNLRLKDSSRSVKNIARFIELSEFATHVIKRRLEQLPEIAVADLTGISLPEIYIIPNSNAVASLNITDEDFQQIIANNNFSFGNVSVVDGKLAYSIRFAEANPINVEDIRNLQFKFKGRVFKLRNIADVGIRQQAAKGRFIAHNQDALNIAIIKQPDAKMTDLRNAVNNLTTEFTNEFPDLIFEQTQDQTVLLEFSINNLKQDLYIGSTLAFLLMFFFLKNIRAPLLIGVTIPVCLIITILCFRFINLSVNIISLSGLVLGVGLMIDNSIIVIDNITQYSERGFSLHESCVKGTTEIIRPLIASAMTTCSVFLPLIFLSGIAGALFYDQAMAVTLGLSVSLLVSVTLLPVLYRLFHGSKTRNFEKEFFNKYGINVFQKFYESGFHWVFRHKIVSLLIVIALMLTNIILFSHLKKEKLPAFEETELITTVDWNRNITVDENAARSILLIKAVSNDILQSNAQVGEQQYLLNKEKQQSPSEAKIYLKVKNSKSLGAVKSRISDYLTYYYPEASLTMQAPKSIFEQILGDPEADLVIQFSQAGETGLLPSIAETQELRTRVMRQFNNSFISPVNVQKTLLLNVNLEKLILYNISPEALSQQIKRKLSVSEVGNLHNGSEDIPIVLRAQLNNLGPVLSSLTVVNSNGAEIPVSGFLRVSQEQNYKTIEGGRSGNYIPLSVKTEDPVQIERFVQQTLKGQNRLNVNFSGSYFSNKQMIYEMCAVLAVAVLLLYFILAAQFESLVQPLIVLFELPISMTGALIMLFLGNSSINLISLIGLVVMCGIIINDSILKIDTVNQLRRIEGLKLMDAIHTAGLKRLKSIIMTATTTILSVAPFLFGNDIGSVLQRPLSLALIGGMLLGTPVSLYFIPLVYWFYYRKTESETEKRAFFQM
ncbi:efflux RND transporter permease subunit [Mucilaginibacter psychrotolerans]|uniref:Efflux RND transporter permease subunit n=1 Tax=Mucilaginibacter psychrotolerans TaxID=1524096 RepID=A0A4Y8SAM8_9SPHI|nr:efflux RND transporter permease subunit [Mucilaginibacter psychrotolerans]TFF36133.1 efflux RND transporter permease subunit [Mucilaginibacter psychrotolerans]